MIYGVFCDMATRKVPPSPRKGQKKGFLNSAKKKFFRSTKQLKIRQVDVFDTVRSANFSTKLVIGALLAIFAVAALISLTKSQISINQKEKILADLELQIAQQQLENDELEKRLNSDSAEYIEDYARDKLDMVKPGERVYINTVGD